MKSLRSSLSVLVLVLAAPAARAQEVPECRSTNPADWPAPSKPYFLLAVDTSTSMNTSIASNSCGYPATRNGGARCAVFNTVQAFSGLVNFGLMTFPRMLFRDTQTTSSPPVNCPSVPNNAMAGCNVGSLYNDLYGTTTCDGCGKVSAADSGAGSVGGNILVPLQQDDYWNPPGSRSASNVSEILGWVDNRCGDCRELWADGYTPLNGLLRDVYRYLSGQWLRPGTTTCRLNSDCNSGLRCLSGRCEELWPACSASNPCPTGARCEASGQCVFPTPLTASERPCRSVNLVLVTDGEEYCGSGSYCRSNVNAPEAQDAAADLLTGFDVNGIHWSVRTHVIALSTYAGVDNIARNGGTDRGYIANNEAELSAALANIISSAIPPEVCDNADNNCNGCTDEGFRTYCNRGRQPVATPTDGTQCCRWTTQTERDACLTSYRNSISDTNRRGDRWRLPCWDPAADPSRPESKWLCADPGEICDERDNNCETSWNVAASPPPNNQSDEGEGFRKCVQDGTGVLKCPGSEVCDGIDNDCDGIRDNAPDGGCPTCQPSPEVCDGRDNDCDTLVDEDLPGYDCGLPSPAPAWCQGQRICQNGAYTACSWSPRPETDYGCNGIDDNCNGIIDDGVTGEACVPGGLTGLTFYDPVRHPYTRCRMGTKACGSSECTGGVGPLGAEVCNGLDDDCDGSIDECDGPTVTVDGHAYCPSLGEGNECGSAVGACRKGHTQCQVVSGGSYLDCGGGTGPAPERCDGVDSDCDGVPDEQDTLVDAPTTPGCWNKAVTDLDCDPAQNNCAQGSLRWCAPSGAQCQGLGALTTPCAAGTLACIGGTWICRGGHLPAEEVCDGADNDCDGVADDNLGPPMGLECGIRVGLCTTGVNYCDNGVIRCTGQGPVPELCDGLDNDCDGTRDNGLGAGEVCWDNVDTTRYPGDRTRGECRPGQRQCDPAGSGTIQCVGGVGPKPEICDGLDNDCDGMVDEPGAAPDGIDGTADPAQPGRRIGDTCGDGAGLCQLGRLVCVQGQVICGGGLTSQVETCDCVDNDCDNRVDEDPGPGEPRLCSPGKTCVHASTFCVCAETCGGGEFPCPTGSTCQNLPRSGTDERGDYCLPRDPCGDCRTATRKDATGATECAPAGSVSSGQPVPVCVCRGQAGCHSPCYNVTCSTGQSCVPTGVFQGQCQPANDCTFFGCAAGTVCNLGACVPDPCSPNPCGTAEVCKPNASFTEHRCVGSCAGITCGTGQQCVDGACSDTGCPTGCPAAESCQPSSDGGFACQPSRCILADGGVPCPAGRACDPVTGQCGNDPCAGVVCPGAEVCRQGECVTASPATDGGLDGSTPSTGGTGNGPQAGGESAVGRGGSSVAAGATQPSNPGVWGLATGGGGCACSVSAPRRAWPAALAGLWAALLLTRRRRRGLPGAGPRGGAR